ncbi:DNA-3-METHYLADENINE GLYCOSYLASE [Salix viminalis]|uniref:DNA-3-METHYLADENINE GLYCOSYLASE n=1 Tax=Salix viminalis TaxID=40686 RepID=A0A9Q0SI40_SALVM|nr:DNA-3-METHYLADENINE GLYCOSYLASE [Salix viminalis]
MGKPITRSHFLPLHKPSSPPLSTTSSSKISFQSRKIRKLSTNKTTSTTTAITSTSIPHLKPLSHKGEIELALDHLTTNAAKSIYTRFLTLCDGESQVNPDTVLSLTAQKLREIGVSGRKASYLHDLAEKYQNGSLSDASILEMDDDMLLNRLTEVKGIGVWSVHMFMLFSLHRPDVLPVGDLGVRKGVQSLYRLKDLPQASEMEQICEKWKPYRSVGSWYMWRLMEAKALANKAAKKT